MSFAVGKKPRSPSRTDGPVLSQRRLAPASPSPSRTQGSPPSRRVAEDAVAQNLMTIEAVGSPTGDLHHVQA